MCVSFLIIYLEKKREKGNDFKGKKEVTITES